MIKFSIEDIATPGAKIEPADVWGTIRTVDAAALKARLAGIRPYGLYLCTPYWKTIAGAIKARDGRSCRMCGSPDRPEVHHPDNCYHYIGEEHTVMEKLLTLCHRCHSKHHDKGSKPGKKRKKKKKNWHKKHRGNGHWPKAGEQKPWTAWGQVGTGMARARRMRGIMQ